MILPKGECDLRLPIGPNRPVFSLDVTPERSSVRMFSPIQYMPLQHFMMLEPCDPGTPTLWTRVNDFTIRFRPAADKDYDIAGRPFGGVPSTGKPAVPRIEGFAAARRMDD
jgi:hypothetical protein